MEWDDLKYFLELARTGTLTAAARRLEVQHSTVARRMSRTTRSAGGLTGEAADFWLICTPTSLR